MFKSLRIQHWVLISTVAIPTLSAAFISSFISVRLAIAHHRTPTPEAMFVLGGGIGREQFSAKFAVEQPPLKIWISSGSPAHTILKVFATENAPTAQLYLDYQATDTVTNFTTIVKQLKEQQIEHVYLATSTFHMARAKAIAFVILGSHGITYTPLEIPSKRPPESGWKTIRDVNRALLWLLTGYELTYNPLILTEVKRRIF